MKLAYIASDTSILKTLPVLQKYYSTVHFYFEDSIKGTLDLEVDNMPLLIDGVTIPNNSQLRTKRHQAVFKKSHLNYKNFFSQIYPSNIENDIENPTQVIPNYSRSNISDIGFIKYNRELNKYIIETAKQEIVEYDFILIENSQLIMAAILDKQQNLFHSLTEQTKTVLTLVFNFKNLHQSQQVIDNFILVENSLIDSVQDNWFLVQLKEKKIEISFYVPVEMQETEDYIAFLTKRVSTMLNNRFVSFKVEELVSHFFLPADGYYSYRAKLRNVKAGALIPTYTFWAKSKVQSHLNHLLKSKLNKKKDILENSRNKS
jgi:hypothetical protein